MIQKNIFIAALFVWLLLTSLSSCARDPVSPHLLLGDVNNNLYLFKLSKNSLIKIGQTPNADDLFSDYMYFSKVDNVRFLFQTEGHSVGIYNLETEQEQMLYDNSQCPVYFQKHNKFLFTEVERTQNGFEYGVFIASLGSLNKKRRGCPR